MTRNFASSKHRSVIFVDPNTGLLLSSILLASSGPRWQGPLMATSTTTSQLDATHGHGRQILISNTQGNISNIPHSMRQEFLKIMRLLLQVKALLKLTRQAEQLKSWCDVIPRYLFLYWKLKGWTLGRKYMQRFFYYEILRLQFCQTMKFFAGGIINSFWSNLEVYFHFMDLQ